MTNADSSPSSTPPSRHTNRRQLSQPTIETLQELLSRFAILNWDTLLVGDGSGNAWDQACGWAAVLIDRQTHGRQLFYGAMSMGSINMAELMPYLQGLSWYHHHYGAKRLKELGRPLNVHIITDSQVTAYGGQLVSAADGQLPKHHEAEWAAMRQFNRLGYQITYHYAPRSTVTLNWLADLVAGQARVSMKQHDPADYLAPEQLQWIRRILYSAKDVRRAQYDQEALLQLVEHSAEALRMVFAQHASPADRAAQFLETVPLADRGSPVDPYQVNPADKAT